MRIRFTAKSCEWWNRVLQYADESNRTPSELICEAIDQIMARYPKRRHVENLDVRALAVEVANILLLQVPAGTHGANPEEAKGEN